MNAWRAPQDVELMSKHRIPHEDGYGSLIRLGHLQSHFIRLFQHQWKILPREEALAVVREIVQIALDRPDLGTSAGYPDGIHFTSSREHVLFEVLHILHHLDPPLAESLIAVSRNSPPLLTAIPTVSRQCVGRRSVKPKTPQTNGCLW
jgi:hypothetical protein